MKKMNNIFDFWSIGLSTISLGCSVDDLTNTLNITLLIVSIINIVLVSVLRIINIVKNKGLNKDSIEEIEDVIEDTTEKIDDKTKTL